MDKRKVITAYRRGFITIQECAQILGIDSVQVARMIDEQKQSEVTRIYPLPMNG
ncbi:hypothetical protein [Paenibacillus sp. GYB003]|uniref:hypothetical protein n=1 Tax=Paenibacillus sp. GYB003 TaxID=2994392 RepID=UPI002F96252C